MRELWEQVRDLVARRIRYRVTRGGVLFTFAAVMVGAGAVISANNLLFLITAAMLATLLVSGLVSRLSLAALQLDFLVPDHVPAGRSVPGRLYVRNLKWLMPSFSIHVEGVHHPSGPVLQSGVYFPVIPGGATLEETVEVRFPRRGAYRRNGFAFSTSFPFGFLEKSARVTLIREMIVYPSIDPKPGFEDLLASLAGEIESHYRGLGRDFYRIRPYEAFESSRHVDWKASAHVGSLQIREFARDQEQTAEIFLDRDVPAELEGWFEHAVDCCAFIAWRLSGRGASVHFRTQGFDMRLPEEGDIYAILKHLALVLPKRGSSPAACVQETSFKIAFTPSASRFDELGWGAGRIFSPATLPAPEGSSPGVV